MTDAPLTSISQVIGHERAKTTLRAALQSGRVHHAWIFSGPIGVGKRTMAEAFASMLLDPTTALDLAGEFEPDPDSETQRLLSRRAHPDLHIITKELALYSDERKIRESRQRTIAKDVIDTHLLGPIALASTLHTDSRASKVFIIDEAELLDASKSNARTQASMLKTMEEPPPGSVIILVTSNEERLLTTIRSRCQRVVFGTLDDLQMKAWMKRAGLDLSGTEAQWTLAFAQGSPGRVMQAVETGLYAWARALEPQLQALDAGRFPIG
ncbi:MAG: AAA family ATPase, partial [Phycisphaerales bacterium]|nr:AAA family ATPase [Phycisphaerales bacterium]